MLLGNFTTYTELTSRVDRAVQHWTTDFYAQDSWRITSRVTLDYGMRFTHAGPQYEVRNMHTGFFPDQWDPARAPRVYKQVCTTGAGNLSCSGANQRAIDPANPGVQLPGAFAGNLVPGTGNLVNGISTEGLAGHKSGVYATFPALKAAPRLGFAWDVTGDGRTALRASTGVFYQLPTTGNGFGYAYVAGCPVSCSKVIRWAHFDAVAAAAAQGAEFVETPIGEDVGGIGAPLGHSYGANVAFQRDLGFNTVAEIAWVGNYVWSPGANVDQNRLPLYVYGNVNNLFNGGPMNAKLSPHGVRSISGYGRNQSVHPGPVQPDAEGQRAAAQRGPSTLAGVSDGRGVHALKGEGYQGYDPYTDEIGGGDAIREKYWGPTPLDRRHNLVVNYSYDIPSLSGVGAVLRAILSNWQVSGVTKLQSGAAVTPTAYPQTPESPTRCRHSPRT